MQLRIHQKIIFLICIIISNNIYANAKHITTQAPQPITESPWTGSSANLGFQTNTGNSRATSLESIIDASYTKPRWNNDTKFKTNYGTGDQGEVTEESYNLSNQSNINFNPKSLHKQFMFGNADYKMDKFSPYYYTINTAGGYGITAINNKRATVTLQSGPGYQYSVSRNGHEVVNSNPTIDNNINAKLYIYKKQCSFSETIIYRISKPYNYLNSVTSLTNNITNHFAVSANYEVSYYSNIPDNSDNQKNVDTITNISLVYTI